MVCGDGVLFLLLFRPTFVSQICNNFASILCVKAMTHVDLPNL